MASFILSSGAQMRTIMKNRTNRYDKNKPSQVVAPDEKVQTPQEMTFPVRSSLSERGQTLKTKRVSFNEYPIVHIKKRNEITEESEDIEDSCLILVPTCKKIHLVNKFTNEKLALKNKGTILLRKENNNNTDQNQASDEESTAKGYLQDSSDAEIIQLSRSKAQQMKHKNRQNFDDLYWRMPSQENGLCAARFLKVSRVKQCLPVYLERSSGQDKLMKTKNNLTRKEKNVRDVGDHEKKDTTTQKLSVKMADPKHTATSRAIKQTHGKRKTQVTQLDVSKLPGAKNVGSHMDNFRKYLEMTRIELHPFEEECIRRDGSSVDPLDIEKLSEDNFSTYVMQPTAKFHPFRTLSTTERNKPHQAYSVNSSSTTLADQYTIRNTGITKKGNETMNVGADEQYRILGIESHLYEGTVPLHGDYKSSSVLSHHPVKNALPSHRSLSQLPTEIKAEIQTKTPSKSQSTLPTNIKMGRFTGRKTKKKGSTAEFQVPQKAKVNISRTQNPKSSFVLQFPEEKSKLVHGKQTLQNKTNTGPTSEINKTVDQISKNTDNSPNVSPGSSNSVIIEFPTTAALWRNAAYMTYAESGQRAKFPDDVIEVVQYNKNIEINNEDIEETPPIVFIENKKLAPSKQIKTRKTKYRVKNVSKKPAVLQKTNSSTSETTYNINKHVKSNKINKKSKVASGVKRVVNIKNSAKRNRRSVHIRKTRQRNHKAPRKISNNMQSYGSARSRGKLKKNLQISRNNKYSSVKSKNIVVIPCGRICRKTVNKEDKSKHVPSHLFRRVTWEDTPHKPVVKINKTESKHSDTSNNKKALNKRILSFNKPEVLVRKQEISLTKKHEHNRLKVATSRDRKSENIRTRIGTRKRARIVRMKLFKDCLPPRKAITAGLMVSEVSSVGKRHSKSEKSENKRLHDASSIIHIRKEVSLSGVSISSKIFSEINNSLKPVLSHLRDYPTNKYSLTLDVHKTGDEYDKDLTTSVKQKSRKLIKRRRKRNVAIKHRKDESQERAEMCKSRLIQFMYSLRKYTNRVPVNSPLQTTSSSSVTTERDIYL